MSAGKDQDLTATVSEFGTPVPNLEDREVRNDPADLEALVALGRIRERLDNAHRREVEAYARGYVDGVQERLSRRAGGQR